MVPFSLFWGRLENGIEGPPSPLWQGDLRSSLYGGIGTSRNSEERSPSRVPAEMALYPLQGAPKPPGRKLFAAAGSAAGGLTPYVQEARTPRVVVPDSRFPSFWILVTFLGLEHFSAQQKVPLLWPADSGSEEYSHLAKGAGPRA